MDAKKAYGVETALGRAIAEHELDDGLRKVQTADEFRRFVESVRTPLPKELLTQWAQSVEDAEWVKVRAKLLLGVKMAKGHVREIPDHEVERTGVGSRPG